MSTNDTGVVILTCLNTFGLLCLASWHVSLARRVDRIAIHGSENEEDIADLKNMIVRIVDILEPIQTTAPSEKEQEELSAFKEELKNL